jgi:hypothetical protein
MARQTGVAMRPSPSGAPPPAPSDSIAQRAKSPTTITAWTVLPPARRIQRKAVLDFGSNVEVGLPDAAAEDVT